MREDVQLLLLCGLCYLGGFYQGFMSRWVGLTMNRDWKELRAVWKRLHQ